MRTIHKYKLHRQHVNEIKMPFGAILLCANLQRMPNRHSEIMLWAEVDTNRVKTVRRIRLFGTGQDLAIEEGRPGTFADTRRKYVDTVFDHGGFVWHVYDCCEYETEEGS